MKTKPSGQRERSDAELVEAARDNNDRAFKSLLLRHLPALQQLLAGLLPPDLVDDVAQDACKIAWLQLNTLDKPASFGSWLCGIGKLLALKAYRWKRKEGKYRARSIDAGGVDDVDTGHTPYSALMERTRRERVTRAIHALRGQSAVVVKLHDLEGLSCPEIAAQLDVRLDTVHKRLSRGRRAVYRALAPMRGQLAAVGGLGAAGARGRPADALLEKVMRAVRRNPRPLVRPGRASALAAAAAAVLLARWRIVLGGAVAIAILLAPAIGTALSGANAVHDPLAGSPDDASPRRARSAAAGQHRPPAPRLPDPPMASRDESERAALLAQIDAPDPDYVVRSASTEAGSAIFGMHDLRPMDAYGEQLYELVSKMFVMKFVFCLRDKVDGVDDRSRILVDLRFSLRRNPECATRMKRSSAIADEGAVRARVAGLELKDELHRFQFSLCLRQAFDETEFPAPEDGAPRDILHHIAVDFGAVKGTIDALCDSVP
jgi:RNA polymerase sigma factor (sigma-70 family)